MRGRLLVAVLLAGGLSLAVQTAPASTTPRITPLPEAQWTDEVHAVFARYGADGPATNDVKTFAQHPELMKGVMPFAAYISTRSTLTKRDRELLILRTAWLCRSGYVWAQHAQAALQQGLADEIRRVAEGPDASGWSPADAALLRLADELHVNAFAGEATWNALGARYDQSHLIDAIFTVAEYTMLSEAMNAFGVPLDAALTVRLPEDVPRRVTVPKLSEPQIRLRKARVAPLEPSRWTPEIRAMLDPTNSGRAVASIYRTIAQHPQLYPPRQRLSEYIRLQSTLTAREREMLILRIGWLCRSDYEWSQHEPAGRRAGLTDGEIRGIVAGPAAAGWASLDAALLRAADELFQDDSISDATWNALTEHYDTRKLMDVVITTAGYRMVSMALNTMGVQLEADGRGFPPTR